MLLKLLHRTSWVSSTMKSPYNALRFNIASDCWPTVGQQSADSFLGELFFTFSLSFKSVDEILWCEYSNETSLAVHVLSQGTIFITIFISI